MGRYVLMVTACATVLCLFMFHGASSANVDADSMAACRQMCSDEDLGNVDASSVDQCALGCWRIALMENQLRIGDKWAENDDGKSYVRTNRVWFFPDTSKWQERMLTSGIGSRSRSAGAYLRIGRRSADPLLSLGYRAAGVASVDSRDGRHRTAGRYLRIGRAGETADREMMASGSVHDGGLGEELSNLRKVNRALTSDDVLQQHP